MLLLVLVQNRVFKWFSFALQFISGGGKCTKARAKLTVVYRLAMQTVLADTLDSKPWLANREPQTVRQRLEFEFEFEFEF
jgi:hypothetical protein